MRDVDVRLYNMLVRVRDFGQARRELFPESSVGGQALAGLAMAITQLDGHALKKISAAREGQRAKVVARMALTDGLERISRTARAIAGHAPGFADPFQFARRPSDRQLGIVGRVLLEHADAVQAPFIAHGQPDTFVADLRALVEAFERALHERDAARVAQVAARAGTEVAFRAGFAAVRTLDVIVDNRCHDDAVTLAIWRQHRRVDYTRKTRAGVAAAAPEPSVLQKIAS